jgi:hypothetical protein
MDYALQEGSLALPEGFQDRTVNMFVLGKSMPGPLSITISRDDLLPGEALATYVDRQVKLLASKMRGYTSLGKQPASLSKTSPIAGVQVDAYYLNDGRPYYQRQAAFVIAPGRAMVFSTTSQGKFTPEQTASWQDMLDSFTPREPAPGSAQE